MTRVANDTQRKHRPSGRNVGCGKLWINQFDIDRPNLRAAVGRGHMGGRMSDLRRRVKRNRDRAYECLQLADMAKTTELGEQYQVLASHYLSLAERDLFLAIRIERARFQPTQRS